MRATVLLAVALVVAAGVVPALAQEEGTVVGRPNVELSATENRFGAGERVTLDVFASNSGDLDRGGPSALEERVKTARNVRLEIDERRMDETLARGVEVRTGEVFAGTVPEGVSGPFAFSLELSESLPPGTYEIPVRVTYDYTNFVRYGEGSAPEYGDGSRTQNEFVTIVVEDRAEFAVEAQNLTRVSAGDYTITVEGWDNLDFDAATRTTVVSLTTDRTVTLDVDEDEATRGQNVRYAVRGSSAGATHYVTIEDNDFRNNQVNERVFRDVEDVTERGSVDVDEDGEADFAYALVTVDEDTGIGVGQIDTTFLDDTNVDINLYEADIDLEAVTAEFGNTEDDRTLNVRQGQLEFEEPAGTYIAGSEVDVRGTAALGVDDVAIYVRDQGDWELVDINEDGQFDANDLISVDADGEWEERDVRLSEANDIMSIPGRYRLGVVESEDVIEDGEIQETLTTSEFSSATSEQTSIIVSEPQLGEGAAIGEDNSSLAAALGTGESMALQDQQNETTQQREPWVFKTYNGQVAVEDGTVEVSGVAPGLDEVLVVMVDSRGRVVTETISVDDNDVFEEDDIELITQQGRQLNEGQIEAMVIGLGRDTVVGDGVVPGQDRAELADLENWIQGFGAGGLTQSQVTDRVLDETVEAAGSDDLVLEQSFRYADARTSVQVIGPAGEADESVQPVFDRSVTPVEVGDTMVVRGLTNRKPDDNTITVEVIDGPSVGEFDSGATDEWSRNGVWSVNLSTDGVEPGTYTLEVDDGDNTDVVQFEVTEPGAAEETPEETPEENVTETETPEETPEENATDENETESQLPNTLEISAASEDETVTYTLAVDGNVEAVSGLNTTAANEELAEGSLTARTSGPDAFQFAGRISEFSVEGNAQVLLNGEEVDPEEVVGETGNNASSVVAPSGAGTS